MRGRSLVILLAVAFASTCPSRAARANETDPLPAFAVHVAVAVEDDKPVRSAAWVDAQLAEAERLYGAFGVHFAKASEAALPGRLAHLETRDDRDALGSQLVKSEINVVIVASLRDVDDPSRLRMGVHWRNRKTPRKHYIIVAADARQTTLAHELGHFFGNGHSTVVDNLMSYERTGADVFLDAAQIRRIRSFATVYLRSKELAPFKPSGA